MTCPVCRFVSDCLTDVSGQGQFPKPGSLTCCEECGALAIFEQASSGRLVLRKLTKEEIGTVMTLLELAKGMFR
jgi:hypothetical protein